MKKILSLICLVCVLWPSSLKAQDDDIYFIPAQRNKQEKMAREKMFIQIESEDGEYEYEYESTRDVDAYNRRKVNKQIAKTERKKKKYFQEDFYENDYNYSVRLKRFYTPSLMFSFESNYWPYDRFCWSDGWNYWGYPYGYGGYCPYSSWDYSWNYNWNRWYYGPYSYWNRNYYYNPFYGIPPYYPDYTYYRYRNPYVQRGYAENMEIRRGGGTVIYGSSIAPNNGNRGSFYNSYGNSTREYNVNYNQVRQKNRTDYVPNRQSNPRGTNYNSNSNINNVQRSTPSYSYPHSGSNYNNGSSGYGRGQGTVNRGGTSTGSVRPGRVSR